MKIRMSESDGPGNYSSDSRNCKVTPSKNNQKY